MDKMWYKARRVISVLLVFAMLASLSPVQVLADESLVEGEPVTTGENVGVEGGEPAVVEGDEPADVEGGEEGNVPADEQGNVPAGEQGGQEGGQPADQNGNGDGTPTDVNDNEPALLDEPVEYTVVFLRGYDSDGDDDLTDEVLASQQIKAGEDAVAPVVPDREGYVFTDWDNEYTSVQNDLKVSAQWREITTVTVTVKYQFADGTQAAPDYVETVVAGTDYNKTIPSPSVNGYEASEQQVTFALESITEDQLRVVTYTGAQVEYTVKRYLQNVADDEYTLDATEQMTGIAGEKTAATSKAYTGFEEGAIPQLTISADGNTVVQIYYTRNYYMLTWNTDGGSYVAPVSYKYGATVETPADPTKIGYTFAGWDQTLETMPAENVTVTAQWTANSQASYTVVYWGANLTGGYDYLYSDVATGTVGQDIPYSASLTQDRMPEGLEVKGFKTQPTVDGDTTIEADGSAVRNVYFDRKIFTIRFYYSTDWFGSEWSEDTDLRITAVYGEDISARWETACDGSGWGPRENANIQYTLFANMPAENLDMYARNAGTGTTITYYVEDLNGEREFYAAFQADGSVHLTVEDQQPITGFTFDSWKQYASSWDWGDHDLWLYYTRNSYTITFENCTGVADATLKYEAKLSGAKPTVEPGRPATVESDYEFVGWALDPAGETMVDWNDTMPAHNLQVYAVWQKPSYTVSFETNCNETVPSQTVLKGGNVTLPNTSEWNKGEGYTFAGWYTDEACQKPFVAEQQVVSNMTLYAKWAYSGICNYIIVILDQDGKEIKRIEDNSAPAGEYVTIQAPEVPGYTPDTPSQSVKIETPNQEVTFTYTKAEAWSATAKYVDADGQPLEDDTVVSDLTGNSHVFYAKAIEGYKVRSAVMTAFRDNPVVTFVYERIANPSYTIKYMDLNDAEISEQVTKSDVPLGQLVTVTAADQKEIANYEFQYATSGYAHDGLILYAYYKVRTQTYVIHHYETDTTNKLADDVTGSGNIGAQLTNVAKDDIPGFTAVDPDISFTINANAKDNVFIVYYDRNKWDLTIRYNYATDIPDQELAGTEAAATYNQQWAYGSSYVVSSPEIDGYTPSQTTVSGTMPDEAVEVTVTYSASSNTKYTVEHYQQNVNDDNYTLADTTEAHGTTGAMTSAQAKSYEGFTAQKFAQAVIKADGTTVVKIYYDRNVHDVIYKIEGSYFSDEQFLIQEDVRYGAALELIDNNMEKQGYDWSGWSDLPKTMPDADVTVIGSYSASDDTKYTVRYLFQNIDDNDYSTREGYSDKELSGTTGEMTQASDLGEITGFEVQPIEQQEIKADGTTIVEIKYNRIVYDLVYQITGDVGTDLAPETKSYRFEKTVDVEPTPDLQGYTFKGWYNNGADAGSQVTINGEITLTGYFEANTDTAYTVEHYLQNVDGTYPDTASDSEVKHGTTGTTVYAADYAKEITGFTYDPNAEGAVAQGTIAGDGTLVLKLYYTRNSNKVVYEYAQDSVIPDGANALLPSEHDYKYGESVEVADALQIDGYTFSGWTTEDTSVTDGKFNMPDKKVTFSGSFTANEDTAFTVEYYLQELDGTYPVTASESEVKEGTTGTAVYAANYAKKITGFTYDPNAEGAVAQGTIAGDGTLVLKLYYTRNTAKVYYQYTGYVPADAEEAPAEKEYKYDETVEIASAPADPQGYHFDGWNVEGTSFTMPDEDVYIYGSFSPNDGTVYHVEHYFQNIENDDYTKDEDKTQELHGTTDKDVSATPYTLEGFKLNEGMSTMSGKVAADGSLVLKVYYDRVKSSVIYAYKDGYPETASALPLVEEYKYGETVTVAEDATAKGYTFSGWTTTDVQINDNGTFTMPAKQVVLNGSFSVNKYPYKVVYYYDEVEGQTEIGEEELAYGSDHIVTVNNSTEWNGVTYALDYMEPADGKLVIDVEDGDEIVNNVVKVYYATDMKGDEEGPDGTPDKYQTVFTYVSADPSTGEIVGKTVETHTDDTHTAKPTVKPIGVAVQAAEGYAFDYWTDSTQPGVKDFDEAMTTFKDTEYSQDATFTVYFDVDVKGNEKPSDPTGEEGDGTPDKYQTIFRYVSAGNGRLEGETYEVTTEKGDSKPMVSPKANVTVIPADGYAFDYWTDNNGNVYWSLEEIRAIGLTDVDMVFTAHFDVDKTGGGDDGEDPDQIPDKYQVKVTYKVANGSWNDGTTANVVEVVTLLDGEGKWSEEGTAQLTKVPGVGEKPNANYAAGGWDQTPPQTVSKADKDKVYTYKYQRANNLSYTVRYLENYTAVELRGSKTVTGLTLGTKVSENAEAIDGYSLLSEYTQTITIGAGKNEIIFYYVQDGPAVVPTPTPTEPTPIAPVTPPAGPTTPTTPTTPTDEGGEELVTAPEEEEVIEEEEPPMAEGPADESTGEEEETIEEAETPLAGNTAWALLNLILAILTALGSVLLLIGYLGKKRKEEEDETTGETNTEYEVKKHGFWRLFSLVPGIGSIIVFLLTEDMRLPMVFTDRWTLLMVIIAVIQVIVAILSIKEKQEPDEDNAARA